MCIHSELILNFSFILGCLKKRYTSACLSKSMPQIRESLNQKCRDLRKKFPKPAYAVSSKSFLSDAEEEDQ